MLVRDKYRDMCVSLPLQKILWAWCLGSESNNTMWKISGWNRKETTGGHPTGVHVCQLEVEKQEEGSARTCHTSNGGIRNCLQKVVAPSEHVCPFTYVDGSLGNKFVCLPPKLGWFYKMSGVFVNRTKLLLIALERSCVISNSWQKFVQFIVKFLFSC